MDETPRSSTTPSTELKPSLAAIVSISLKRPITARNRPGYLSESAPLRRNASGSRSIATTLQSALSRMAWL
jgi:hypothetical protein